MYLLDTNVVSELRKGARAHAVVRDWAAGALAGSSWISAISLMELEIGVLRVERRDGAQGEMLRHWFEQGVLVEFKDRTMIIDAAIARAAARLHVPDPRPERDALIAATALTHGLTVVTRNISDFEPMAVDLINPWLAPGAKTV